MSSCLISDLLFKRLDKALGWVGHLTCAYALLGKKSWTMLPSHLLLHHEAMQEGKNWHCTASEVHRNITHRDLFLCQPGRSPNVVHISGEFS